jgi:RsiW-degrading membrane proteinase PrsW (M82 family)
MDLFLLSLTILPPILIVIIFAVSDKFKESNKEIFLVFISGILITIPAYIANNFLIQDVYANYPFISESLASSFLSAAVVEEGLKFALLYFVVYRLREFNEPMDAMVYGVCVSLGFAASENIFYVYYLDLGEPIYVAIFRMFMTIPAHGIFGAMMGYFFMRYVFIHKSKSLFFSFLIPFLLHGFYNYFLYINSILSLVLIVVFWFIGIKLFLKLKQEQRLKRREYEKKI